MTNFQEEVQKNIAGLSEDRDLQKQSFEWVERTAAHKYSYNFSWLGRPIIQYPQDVMAIQELIWNIKPDLILETGIAHGGSLILSASMLALLDICEPPQNGTRREVIGVDIDIREHNKKAVLEHPMSRYITMLEGSSISDEILTQVKAKVDEHKTVLVILDSNHTHDHVLAELQLYAPFTTVGSYCVVLDTVVEDMPTSFSADRPWGPGNNPKTAVWEYLKEHPEFEIDKALESKLLVTVAPDGYLKRLS